MGVFIHVNSLKLEPSYKAERLRARLQLGPAALPYALEQDLKQFTDHAPPLSVRLMLSQVPFRIDSPLLPCLTCGTIWTV